MAVALLATAVLGGLMAQPSLACTSIPAPIRDIAAIDYHVGAGSLVIDPVLRARNDTAMEPLRTFARLVSAAADRFVADGKAIAAVCALADLRQWAEGGALLGVMANGQAGRERAGLLSAVAFAYLKTKGEATTADRAAIDAWLDRLAAGVETSFNDQDPLTIRNRELAGLAALAVGATTGNRDHWRFGEATYDQLLAAIGSDGVLVGEMAGGELALFDQDYALGVLVMMAELAAKQSGEDWYGRRGGAIHRLADRVLDGLRDPSWFAEQTGKGQFLPTGRDLAWVAFYARRFPVRFAGRVPDGAIFQSPRLGGDLTALAEKWVRN
jgi:poly(beta-D-mannuronate) lyase